MATSQRMVRASESAQPTLCHITMGTLPVSVRNPSSPLDVDINDLFHLKKACVDWPARDRPLALGVVYRWAQKGRRGIRLRTVEVPGVGKCTTERWIREFVEAVNAPIDTATSPCAPPRRRLLRDRLVGGDSQ